MGELVVTALGITLAAVGICAFSLARAINRDAAAVGSAQARRLALTKGSKTAPTVEKAAAGPTEGSVARSLRHSQSQPALINDVDTVAAANLTSAEPRSKPDAHGPAGDAAPTAQASEIEARIAAVWQEVLQVRQVAIDANFFDLGGHSLHAVAAHRRLVETLNVPGLQVVDILRFPTARTLAAHLRGERGREPAATISTQSPSVDSSVDLTLKLDLAEEFRQIGDIEGARDLLEQIAAEASGNLKGRAQRLLDKLS